MTEDEQAKALQLLRGVVRELASSGALLSGMHLAMKIRHFVRIMDEEQGKGA